MRVIAGPNGSGKTSVFHQIHKAVHVGHYVNPDELASEFQRFGLVDLDRFELKPEPDALKHYLRDHRSFVTRAEQEGEPISLRLEQNLLKVEPGTRCGYTAALAAGFIREQLVASRQSFTFESVLSDANKLLEIQAAKDAGFRIYLYFVCTEDPLINVERVQNRVREGGHNVPEDRIRGRYARTLEQLEAAFDLSDRAYLFDNSTKEMELVLEADGKHLHARSESIPAWAMTYLVNPIQNRSRESHRG